MDPWHSLFCCLLIDKHDSFVVWTIMNKTTMNICMQLAVWALSSQLSVLNVPGEILHVC